MDSSENDKTTTNTSPTTMAAATTTSSSDSTAIQDSTIFSYISNLSPIKPVKAASVVPGFPGLNSPPIVFTSPRLNPLRETSYLKRPGCPQLSSAELSQQDVRGNNIIIGSNEFEISKTQGSSALAPCIEKECDYKGSVQDQAASPSGCIDEYLTDAVEVDCANSAHLSSLSLIQSDDMPRSLNDCTDSNKITPKLDSKNNMGQDAEKALGTFPSMLEQAGEDLQGNSSSNNKPVETEMKEGGSEMPPSMCPKVESDLTIHQAFEERHRELLVAQHCGMHRRCLRFEEDPQNIMASGPDFWSPSNNVTSSRLPASPADLDVFESSCIEETATSSKRQLINLTQPTISTTFPRNSGNSRSTVSKPSGIGLHLNNAINAMPMGCGATGSMKSAEKGYLNTEGKKFAPSMGSHRPESTTYSTILSNMRERVSASSEDNSHETQASVATGSLASQSPQIVKPSNDPALLKQCEYQTTPCDKRKSISELADAVQELNQSSPKKKRINVFKFSRKKALTTDNVDGCKRCNCKKTKCLKLYCDCFAAGIYCDEPCACQGCFNTPEYEDTVLETRQQIECRNPLAFAPKILQRVTDSPANSSGDGNNSTPSSARHKRGCNCKKSMCLKKYCECYQANVGCSSGCRCEGCKNIYGRMEEYGLTKDVLSKEPIHGRFESPFDEKLEIAANQDGLLQTELCNPLNLTPLTPSFQFSDHGNDLSKSQFSTRRCLPSPESNLNLLQYGKSPGSSGNSDYHDMLLNARKDIEDVVSCHQELDYSNVHTVDEFSLRYDVFANVCDFSTLPNPPSTAMGSSASSKISDWTTISTAQLCPGSGRLSSESSLHWRSSPITPVAQFGGIKLLQAVDSDKKLHDIMEDDTPEILKDISNTLNAVKVSSPNKKCVSPPHSHLQELGSNSSAGLRSGRKFILQAVPSFPPLTPCIDSRGSSSHNINDTQDCSSKK